MTMQHMKHFIWDFDGTLLDTYPNTVRYLRLALQEYGADAPPVEILGKMMTNLGTALSYYSELYRIPDLRERYEAHRLAGAGDPVPAFSGVLAVLQAVRKMGGANYIFTNRGNSTYSMLDQAGLSDEFREIVTATHPAFVVKPAPDVILYLMKQYGGTPENTVMIGDRVCDLEAGYRAGCRTCHLLTPAVPQYPKCDWRIENYQAMLRLLRT